MSDELVYPPGAYDPQGRLWWQIKSIGGRAFGGEKRIAAWLAFNAPPGAVFTMRDIREALGDDERPDDAEHLNRRLRRLRQDGWVIFANKDDRTLSTGVYKIRQHGWHPGLGQRPKNDATSQGLRRRVLDRDGRRCVICGVGSGEPYPDDVRSKAVLTIGHRKARDKGGSSTDLANLQAECKRCNEPVRNEMADPETMDQVWLDVRRLRLDELHALLEWIRDGRRTRSRVDEVYDRVRRLSSDERAEVGTRLGDMLGVI